MEIFSKLYFCNSSSTPVSAIVSTSISSVICLLSSSTLMVLVFILRFGNIGIDLARHLRPFGALRFKMVAHMIWLMKKVVMKIFTTHVFASKADIIVCCLSLNSETAGTVNKSFISSMRKGALLVNIARGGLLDYEAVLYHLESGHFGGLGIDVAWTEPIDPDVQF
ncbi:hypothetical protein FH972_012993 [Carpinus fangiana]|uniref:D-isomer specific 2-hydroxyacid dehydrogenase NAD-binding domain-containing protein n=1 Tax=Carpinus fangiana TaxID=176857 RepID=A0A5N6R5G6_9ROSI|nr:hypothetical protein FH972_012993 [Carpinus fangiana]